MPNFICWQIFELYMLLTAFYEVNVCDFADVNLSMTASWFFDQRHKGQGWIISTTIANKKSL